MDLDLVHWQGVDLCDRPTRPGGGLGSADRRPKCQRLSLNRGTMVAAGRCSGFLHADGQAQLVRLPVEM